MLLEWLKIKIPSISTGGILRGEIAANTPLGAESKATMAAGGLVDDALINRLLEARIAAPDCDEGFLLDGYPRTRAQAQFLDGLLTRRELSAPLVLHLDVPADVLIGRMVSRRQCGECGLMFNILSKRPKSPGRCDACGGPLLVRKDDREEVIRERLRTYEAQTRPVLSHYESGNYFRIRADRAPGYIFEEITSVVEQYLSKRPADRVAARLNSCIA